MSHPMGSNETILGAEPQIVSYSGPADEGGIAEFHSQAPPPQPVQNSNAILGGDGNRFMDAGRYMVDQSGFTSEQPTSPPAFVGDPVFRQDVLPADGSPQEPTETPEDFRRKYGETLNKLGEERKVYQSQMDQLQRQIQELQQRSYAPVSAPDYAAPVYAPAYAAPATPNPLSQHSPDDALTINDFAAWQNWYEQTEVIPALRSMAQTAEQRALASAQRQFGGWNVSAQEEQSIRNEFPWLVNVPPQEQNRFILKLANNNRPATLPTQQPNLSTMVTQPPQAANGQVTTPSGVQARPVVVDPRSMVRRQTFVEQAAPASAPPDTMISLTPAQRMEREMTALDAEWQKQGRERAPATEMKKVMQKYGYGEVNDWGGNVLTR